MLDYQPTFYVYTYAYPDGTVFYVGKGRGTRILRHETEARNGVQSTKCEIIRSIWQKGEQVVKKKVAENLLHKEALELESQLILEYGLADLVNKLPGRKQSSCEFRKMQIGVGYDAATHRNLLIRGLPLEIITSLQEQAQEDGMKCEDWLFQQVVLLAEKE